MAKKKSLVFLVFYMAQKFEAILKWKSLAVREGGRGGYISRQILLKSSKSIADCP